MQFCYISNWAPLFDLTLWDWRRRRRGRVALTWSMPDISDCCADHCQVEPLFKFSDTTWSFARSHSPKPAHFRWCFKLCSVSPTTNVILLPNSPHLVCRRQMPLASLGWASIVWGSIEMVSIVWASICMASIVLVWCTAVKNTRTKRDMALARTHCAGEGSYRGGLVILT